MIQTEVKKLGTHEHEVLVKVPQSEYDRIFADQMKKFGQKAKVPGFRPGKMPANVIKQQFGDQIHEDTVTEILQTYYAHAIDSTGLAPAVQPQLDVPAVQPAGFFTFTMKVTTWPEVEVGDLGKLAFDVTAISVEESDIQAVTDRLMASQVRYEIEQGRAAEQGDQLHIDFVGFVDGEAFEGGRGEDVALVLGEGRFIPGFEDQLIGKQAGEECTVEVTFPEQYQATHLAGKPARFDTVVKSVGKAVRAEDEDALATMLGFADAAALREDVSKRLQTEAEQGSLAATREAAFDALLAANPVELPAALLEADIRETTKRVLQNMKQQGVPVSREMAEDEGFKQEVRKRSERGLALSVLLQSLQETTPLSVDEAEIDAEIEVQAQQYPAEQHEQFKQWVKGQKEQLEAVRERLLERKYVDYIVSQAKTNKVAKTLTAWQEEREAA